MDNHPIPQDVTHFQFKLIGEMTIKQFAYIAAAAIMIWIFIAAPISFLLKLPIIGLLGTGGVVFAFIPIEGRPADLMITYFIKALFAPDRYIYQKVGGNFDFSDLGKATIIPIIPIMTHTQQPIQPIPLPRASVQSLPQKPAPVMQTAVPKAPQPAPRPILITTPVYDDEPNIPTKQPEMPKETPRMVTPPPTPTPVAHIAVTPPMQIPQPQQVPAPLPVDDSLKKELDKTLSEKETLEQELLTLKQQLETQKTEASKAPVAPLKKVATPSAIRTPVMPEFPNLITGVVKDARGNVLPNILIEVKDKDNNPVRAFKTNQLGQFASATPLLNGIYTIIFEDPAKEHTFDSIEITATGDILTPIEMTSVDKRESLRKELFG